MTKISRFPQTLGVFTLDPLGEEALIEALSAIKGLEESVKAQVLKAFAEDALIQLPESFMFRRPSDFANSVEIYRYV